MISIHFHTILVKELIRWANMIGIRFAKQRRTGNSQNKLKRETTHAQRSLVPNYRGRGRIKCTRGKIIKISYNVGLFLGQY